MQTPGVITGTPSEAAGAARGVLLEMVQRAGDIDGVGDERGEKRMRMNSNKKEKKEEKGKKTEAGGIPS